MGFQVSPLMEKIKSKATPPEQFSFVLMRIFPIFTCSGLPLASQEKLSYFPLHPQ